VVTSGATTHHLYFATSVGRVCQTWVLSVRGAAVRNTMLHQGHREEGQSLMVLALTRFTPSVHGRMVRGSTVPVEARSTTLPVVDMWRPPKPEGHRWSNSTLTSRVGEENVQHVSKNKFVVYPFQCLVIPTFQCLVILTLLEGLTTLRCLVGGAVKIP